jgi:hypothetical protein
VLAVPGSPFLGSNSDVLVIRVAAGWAVWSGMFVVPVPVLLVILATLRSSGPPPNAAP